MAHAHGVHGTATSQVTTSTRRVLAGAAAVCALVTMVGLVALWPSGDVGDRLSELGFAPDVYDAEIGSVETVPCEGVGPSASMRCRRYIVDLKDGPDKGSSTTFEFPDEDFSPDLQVGDAIVVTHDPEAGEGFEYSFADHDRQPTLVWVALLFAVAVVLLGRVRGLAALAGLAASFLVLLQFVLPAILDGTSPLLVAVVGASAIAFLALYLAHGFGPMTTVALLGTLASLVLTVVLASVFVELANITGYASEEAGFLKLAETRIDLAGIVLGGIVIGALGAIDDMTVTQASVVAELRAADPSLGRARLFTAAMRVGRDHVASTVNTLALAYAGASMPLLLLFVLSKQSLGSIVNGEVVATEVLRTLVGSVGLVASVPITTWLAILVLEGRAARRSAGSRPAE